MENKDKICLVLNCGKTVLAKDYCRRHYTKFQKSYKFEIGQICEVENCIMPEHCKKLCTKHYTRLKKHGDVNRDINAPEEKIKKFWARVDIKSNSECWEWQGCRDYDGYGRITWNYKNQPAHVLAFLLHGKTLKEGEVVRHKICRNPPCCNPSHLLAGTYKDNHQDSVIDGTWARGEINGHSKLNEKKVLAIKLRYKNGEKQLKLAKEFGVDQSQISYIVNGKHWAYLND